MTRMPPDAADTAGPPVTEPVLVSFPPLLFAAAVEQWAGLLREYALRGFGAAEQPYSSDDVAAAARALDLVASAVDELAGSIDLADLPDRVDLPITIEAGTVGEFATLQAVLEDARRLAASGQLLVLPTLPEIAALRDWICEQVGAEVAGAAPVPWEFVAAPSDDGGDVALEWDPGIQPPPGIAWLVGDDRNRIAAASPAALAFLGWGDELVGQRLLVVIPPEFRERHVAAFTRSVVRGDEKLLGLPLPLHALTRDGREVPITLTLTRHPARRGRTVYLATLELRERAE